MSLYNSVFGVLYVEMVTAAPEQMITKLNHAGIALYDVKRSDEITVFAAIRRKDVKALMAIIDSEGGSLKLRKKSGFIWDLLRFKKRPILICSLLLWLIITVFLPSRILFVEVDGNQNIQTAQIIDTASECGIAFGTVRRDIRSEEFKNKMLERIPQLQWLGVNTSGCVAKISVKERQQSSSPMLIEDGNCIIALRDGIIRSTTVISGNPMCNVGDVVEEGQLLISGLTDLGTFVRLEDPEGEIFADTTRTVCAITPIHYLSKEKITDTNGKYGILIGKKLINLFKDSGISGTGCDRIYKIYTLTLPGGYPLPLSLICYTEVTYKSKVEYIRDADQFDWLHGYVEGHLQKQMIAGTVRSKDEYEKINGDVFQLHCVYQCNEMIGKKTYKEFTEEYGKRD